MHKEDAELGLSIKEYIEKNGISQAYISRKTGINHSKLNMGLNGNRKITFYEYALICGVLGVNTDFFLKPILPEEVNK